MPPHERPHIDARSILRASRIETTASAHSSMVMQVRVPQDDRRAFSGLLDVELTNLRADSHTVRLTQTRFALARARLATQLPVTAASPARFRVVERLDSFRFEGLPYFSPVSC